MLGQRITEIKRLASDENYKELEKLLLSKNLPQGEWASGLTSSSPLSVFARLLAIKSCSGVSKLENYKELLVALDGDRIFTEKFNFKLFFEDLLFEMRKVFSKQGAEEEVEPIISPLNRIFSEIRKSEFYDCTPPFIITLFFLNFKINHFNQSKIMMNILGDLRQQTLTISSKKNKILLNYYFARMSIMEGQFEMTEKYLDDALLLSPSRNQKRKLLELLVPIKLILGKLPGKDLLASRRLAYFAEIITAVKAGNLHDLEAVLQTNLVSLLNKGIYFLLCDAKQFCQRNLLQKGWLLLDKPSVLSLEELRTILEFGARKKLNDNEVISQVSGLIYKRFLSGTIRLESKELALKSNPFPSLT